MGEEKELSTASPSMICTNWEYFLEKHGYIGSSKSNAGEISI
jgi:hypothetical protein